MSSVLNMLGLENDGGLQFVIVLPVVVVLVAFVLLLKLSIRKPEITKKSLGIKKQSKGTTNKQKEDKSNSDKKDKVNKEKKTPSPAKILDTANVETVKTKPNKKQVVANEKSPKKNVQTKKQQVNNNVSSNSHSNLSKNQTNNQKQLESFLTKEEEGEWQTVTTKKQKQNKQDEATVEATTPSKTNKKIQKNEKATKTSKIKKGKESEQNDKNSTANVNGEVTPTELNEVSKTEIIGQVQANEIPVFTTNIPIQKESSVPEPSTPADNDVVKVVTEQNVLTANVAFDELGDDGWTDTKPQKKNRKKALRE